MGVRLLLDCNGEVAGLVFTDCVDRLPSTTVGTGALDAVRPVSARPVMELFPVPPVRALGKCAKRGGACWASESKCAKYGGACSASKSECAKCGGAYSSSKSKCAKCGGAYSASTSKRAKYGGAYSASKSKCAKARIRGPGTSSSWGPTRVQLGRWLEPLARPRRRTSDRTGLREQLCEHSVGRCGLKWPLGPLGGLLQRGGCGGCPVTSEWVWLLTSAWWVYVLFV